MENKDIIKIVVGSLIGLFLLSIVLGFFGFGYGMMGGIGMGLYGVIWFAIAAFVFSVIFWLTYRWIVKGNKVK